MNAPFNTLILCALITGCDTTTPPQESKANTTPDITQLYELLDVPPVAIGVESPKYPSELKRKGFEGVVTFEFVVNEEGKTEEIRVLKSDHQLFSESVVKAVSDWTFKPAQKDSMPTKSSILKVHFFKIDQS